MSTRDDLTTAMNDAWVRGKSDVDAAIALLAERGMVVLGPDGEPLDVRPALRMAGQTASNTRLLSYHYITGPLADACLAAAEVEP